MVRVLGPQGAVWSVKLNVPVPAPDAQGNLLSHVYDLARGKYDVTDAEKLRIGAHRSECANGEHGRFWPMIGVHDQRPPYRALPFGMQVMTYTRQRFSLF